MSKEKAMHVINVIKSMEQHLILENMFKQSILVSDMIVIFVTIKL